MLIAQIPTPIATPLRRPCHRKYEQSVPRNAAGTVLCDATAACDCMSACRRRSPECAAGCMCLTYNWFYWCVCVFRSMVVVVADVVLVDYLDLVQCTGFAYATMESTNIREINQLNTQHTYEYVCICVCVFCWLNADVAMLSNATKVTDAAHSDSDNARVAPQTLRQGPRRGANFCPRRTRAPVHRTCLPQNSPSAGPHDPISAQHSTTTTTTQLGNDIIANVERQSAAARIHIWYYCEYIVSYRAHALTEMRTLCRQTSKLCVCVCIPMMLSVKLVFWLCLVIGQSRVSYLFTSIVCSQCLKWIIFIKLRNGGGLIVLIE